MTSRTSCGAAGSKRAMMRRIFSSSSIRPADVCRRPAVSAMTTSMPRARAAESASCTTAAGSAPGACETTGTFARSPHSTSCSTAAARNVSPAASSTEKPCARRRALSLPIVVVLPVPFTPPTSITYGFCARSISSGTSTGFRSSSRAARSASCAASCEPAFALRRRSISHVVTSTPTSAVRSRSSNSSSDSSSMPRPNSPPDSHERPRLIGGEWRGRRLEFPDRPTLRPTPDRVRETLFNWLAPVLPGARCLDLFAGTGCLGLEALSRGAAEAWFVEADPVLARVLAAHVEKLGANARVIRADARRFLKRQAASELRFDVAFVDPPFREPIEPWLGLLRPVLAPGALVYLERPLPDGLPDAVDGEWVKRARAGGVEFGLLSPP